jgi:hypothetical protein
MAADWRVRLSDSTLQTSYCLGNLKSSAACYSLPLPLLVSFTKYYKDAFYCLVMNLNFTYLELSCIIRLSRTSHNSAYDWHKNTLKININYEIPPYVIYLLLYCSSPESLNILRLRPLTPSVCDSYAQTAPGRGQGG